MSATFIGRLAVATERQGQRLGAVLLAAALQRAFESASTVGSSMAVVDTRQAAAGLYARTVPTCATRRGPRRRCASQAGRPNDRSPCGPPSAPEAIPPPSAADDRT